MGKLQIAIIPAKKTNRKIAWGEIVNSVKVFACHDAQLEVLASTAKFTFAFAGSGGGKTCLIPLWLFKQINKNPKGRFLVVSPTFAKFKTSELKRHILDTFANTAYEGKWKEQDKTYLLPTGGEIVVLTAEDDPERLRGGVYHAAVADECYLLSSEAWEEIRRRVGTLNGPILAVTTPDGNNWIWDVKQLADKGDKDYLCVHWSKLANPIVSLEDIEREKSLMSRARFDRMISGQFSALEGLIFDCFADPNAACYPVIRQDPYKGLPSPPMRFFGGNDWGYKPDPAAVLMFAECEDGNIYAVEEIYGTEITPDDMAIRVRALIDKWSLRVDSKYADIVQASRFGTLWTDVSRPEEAAMFRKAGIPIRNKKVTDILAGIAITDSWFRSGRLKVYSCCQNLIRELKGYQWDTTRGGAIKDIPKDRDNHLCFIAGTLIATNKGQVPIEQIKIGDEVLTRKGYRKVIAAAMTETLAATKTLKLSNGKTITATANHPFFVKGKGFIPLDAVSNADRFITYGETWLNLLNTMGEHIDDTHCQRTEATKHIINPQGLKAVQDTYIGRYGKTLMELFPKASISITKTIIQAITICQTLNYWKAVNIYPYMVVQRQLKRGQERLCGLLWNMQRHGINRMLVGNGIASMVRSVGITENLPLNNVNIAELSIRRLHSSQRLDSVLTNASQQLDANQEPTIYRESAKYVESNSAYQDIRPLNAVPVYAAELCEGKPQRVYNLTVDGEHEYFANGILVSNCDAIRYAISSQKYGVRITPAIRPQLDETAELEKLIQHGNLAADPTRELEELEAARENKRLTERIYGTDLEDDPDNIWTMY